MLTEKQQTKRRAIVRELLSSIDRLRDELVTCTSIGRRREIAVELKRLRVKQSRLSLVVKELKVAPLPPSFVERIKIARKATSRMSGRDQIKARFLQGGAPGSGK